MGLAGEQVPEIYILCVTVPILDPFFRPTWLSATRPEMRLLSSCPSKYLLAPPSCVVDVWLVCSERFCLTYSSVFPVCLCCLGGGLWADGPGEVLPTAQYLSLSLREH